MGPFQFVDQGWGRLEDEFSTLVFDAAFFAATCGQVWAMCGRLERLLGGQPVFAFVLAALHLLGSLFATYLGLLTLGAGRIWA